MAPPKKRNKLFRHEMQFSVPMLAWLKMEAERQDTSIAAIVRQAVLLLMERKSETMALTAGKGYMLRART